MKSFLFIIIGLTYGLSVYAQTVSGNFKQLKNVEIKLYGFKGVNSYQISNINSDNDGNFILNFSKDDYGMGYLATSDNKSFVVVLSSEDLELNGETLGDAQNIRILKGKENLWFEQYVAEQPLREQALSAWNYLDDLYSTQNLFLVQKSTKKEIVKEKNRILKEEDDFLKNLPKESFVSWYLPIRKFVSSVTNVQNQPEKAPGIMEIFRKIDFSNPKMIKSGLIKDAIKGHFWVIENTSNSEEIAFKEMKISIDSIMKTLIKNTDMLNDVGQFLFNYLESQGYSEVSEYLALNILNSDSCGCSIQPGFAGQLEQYKSMKTGNKAVDIEFKKDLVMVTNNGQSLPKKLSEIISPYKLVVFAASWCPTCVKEIPKIAQHYSLLKSQGIEVVLISLDTDVNEFQKFTKNLPFISYCDYQKWESPAAKDYYVFATPSLFLLDKDNTILLKPDSIEKLNMWLDENFQH